MPRFKPRVGIDLDGVFTDFSTPALEEIASRGFPLISQKEITAYEFDRCIPGFTKEDWVDVYYRTLTHRPHFFRDLAPYSSEDLAYVFELCKIADVYVVSARSETGPDCQSVTTQTAAWCRKHNLPVAGVFIVDGLNKAEALKFLRCSHFIDDAPKTFVNCLENGINVWLYDQPWNREIPTSKRISTIKEYHDIVNR
jgi:uncharacterized HAD superfamily protein